MKQHDEAVCLMVSGLERIEMPKMPEFSHLADFVERRVTVANTAFGKLVGARPKGDIKPKF